MNEVRYPIYIISKGRADQCLTARFLGEEGLPFKIVVEPQEFEAYQANFGPDNILALPFSDLGQGATPARNWVKDNATADRHWLLDDDFKGILRYNKGKGHPVTARESMSQTEAFTDRYQNVAVTSLMNSVFAFAKKTPFTLNQMVYGFMLIRTDLPYQWRSTAEDADFSLQVLSGGWCTIVMSIYAFQTVSSGANKGGNKDIYHDDGRIKRARELERLWPYLIKVRRGHGNRPVQDLARVWRKFDNQLVPV